MKKIALLSLVAITLLASCGGNKKQTTNEKKTFQQEQLEALVKMQADSIAALWADSCSKVPFLAAIADGQLVLSEQEKLVKPDYLLDTKQVEDFVDQAQRYRALAMYNVDSYIAKAYGMPTEDYEAASQKLGVEINDPALEALINNFNSGMSYKELINEFYKDEEENQTLNYFWEVMTASTVEQIYVLAKHPDNQLINSFDDKAAQDLTYRIILLQEGLDRLKEYDSNLEEIAEAIKPLQQLDAISLEQFKEQLASLKDDIADVREALLK